MNCEHCNAIIKDSSKFCKFCGRPVTPQTGVQPFAPQAGGGMPSRKSDSRPVLLAVLIVVMLILGGLLLFALQWLLSDENKGISLIGFNKKGSETPQKSHDDRPSIEKTVKANCKIRADDMSITLSMDWAFVAVAEINSQGDTTKISSMLLKRNGNLWDVKAQGEPKSLDSCASGMSPEAKQDFEDWRSSTFGPGQ